MDIRKSRLWLLPVLILAYVLVQPAGVQSQCVVATTGPPVTFFSTIGVTKMLSVAGMCTRTMQMNNLGCFPNAAPMTTISLIASALTTQTNPSCGWTCECGGVGGPITTGPADGLPVELMDFGFEDEQPSEDADRGAEEAGGR